MAEDAMARALRERLTVLVGEWSMEASFGPPVPGAHTVFEWMAGEEFLIQRWEVPHPAAPDGISIIGIDREREGYTQHYFDSRGVARIYRMSLEGPLWRLWRTEADFTPLEFSQRFAGRISEDGRSITGRWETSSDGNAWTTDFDLLYKRNS